APGWGCPSVPVDVLRTLGMQAGRDGVSVTAGICPQRPGTEAPDFAFRVDNSTQLSAPTRQLFPDGSFPEDFSVLATVRARRGGQAFLLSIYDERGVQQLGVEIGLSPVFLYEDQAGRPAPELYPVFRRVNLADGRWHRVALAVEGTNVSLLVDCHLIATLPLERGPQPLVSTEGVTIFGARLLDEEVFEGDVQQLLIVADPEAAHSYCHLYMPDCDQPLLYPLLAPFPEEVSTQTGKGKKLGGPLGASTLPDTPQGCCQASWGELPGALTPVFLSPPASRRAARSPRPPHVGRARRERGRASARARARRKGTRSCWSSTRPRRPPSQPAR
uniref:Thrombospondin-like N-terminal domain-containing protein n=1 Tax=Strix occidentalis caurina TaxID=311401 RepID=A0A8D0FUN6_STROC